MEPLILKCLEGSATPDETQALNAWRAASPENERTFRELSRLWGAIPSARSAETVASAPPPHELMARAGVRRLSGHTTLQRRKWLRLATAGGAVAAALILFLVGAHILGRPDEPIFGADEFVTGPSGVSTVTLRDGSAVRLGPRSRLQVMSHGANREVRLEGRAFFAVAHAPEHPFRILTSAGTVTALGTRFDLSATGDNLSVALLEGRVVLSTPGSELTLKPGQATRVVDGTALPVGRIPDRDRLLDWAGNFLAFQETPLGEAALEIERLYNVRISITDSALSNRTVTATFADRTLDEVLRIVCAATLAQCSVKSGNVTVRPAR